MRFCANYVKIDTMRSWVSGQKRAAVRLHNILAHNPPTAPQLGYTLGSMYGQKYADTWPSHTYVVLPQTIATKLEADICMKYIFIWLTVYSLWNEELQLFQHDTTVPVHQASFMSTWVAEVGVEILECPWVHKALTSTWLNIFGMNWNTDFTPGLLIQHQCPIILTLLWRNLPSHAVKSSGKPLQRSGGHYKGKVGTAWYYVCPWFWNTIVHKHCITFTGRTVCKLGLTTGI